MVEVQASRAKLIPLIFGGAFLVTLGGGVYALTPSFLILGVAIVFVAMGLFLAWSSFTSLMKPGPALILDESGILDRRIRLGRVEWRNIKSVRVDVRDGGGTVFFNLHRPDEALAQMSTTARFFNRLSKADVTISLHGLAGNAREISDLIVIFAQANQEEAV